MRGQPDPAKDGVFTIKQQALRAYGIDIRPGQDDGADGFGDDGGGALARGRRGLGGGQGVDIAGNPVAITVTCYQMSK